MSGKAFKAMSGTLQVKANHKWTSYDFKTCGVYFHYFGAKSSKAVGELFKAQIREVKPTGKQHKGADNCFEVHHTGSGSSPWVLSAPSREDCIKWMECLQPGSSALLKAPPSPSAQPPSPYSPSSGHSPGYQYNGHQQFPYNGHQQGSYNGYQYNGSLHESMNLGRPLHGSSFSGTLPSQSTTSTSAHDRNAFSTPVNMSREEFLRQAGNEPARNDRVNPQGGAVQNDYVRYGSSKPVEPVDELPEPEEDDRYVANLHARSLTCPKSRAPQTDKQQQQQQQKPKPTPRQRLQTKPRTNLPASGQPPQPERSESYEYMSSKGVPSPEEQNFHDNPNETMGRSDSSSNLPPKPPMRPRHTLQEIKSDFLEADDVFDGRMDARREPLSPSYVDPTELNTAKLPRGGSVDAPTPPLPLKRSTSQSSEKAYADFLRYFSPEQMLQLADMFKEVAGIQDRDSPQQPQVQPSSELVSVLRKTSQNLPDQILNQQDEYIIGEDDSTKKWARANSRPHGSQSDKLAVVQDINDPIYQMQREAFTIQKEALSDFTVIGKGQYGVVEAALYRPSPGSVPIKVAIKKTKETCSQLDKDNFYKEIVVMAQFMHPNIVRVFGSVDKGVSSPWLVLEFLSNGDLKSFLKCNSRPVHRLVKYMVDIAMGMHYLSEKGYVHRDLAARNIFMDENELCKVGDFGLLRETSSRHDDGEKHYIMQSELALPVRWMAVECLTKQIFSSASDVWSFGVLMWELFNPLTRPYRSMDNMSVIASVSAGRRLDIPEKCPTKVGQVMQACWNADQTKRPSFLVIANLLCRCIQQETPSRT